MMEEKLALIRKFQLAGLTAFQAMAATLDDADWDLVLAALEDRFEVQAQPK